MTPITDNVLIFTVIISVILLAPLLAARLRIPDLVLLLLAGAALGGHGFGVLERNEAITLFGEVGLIYIMFLAGLEIDLYQFSRTKGRSIGFGMITFLLPQTLGAAAVYYLLGDLAWASAILMASMFASHTLLAYPVASRLGIHRSEPVTIAVGATIITDTLALLVLAVVVDAAQDIALDLKFWTELLAAMAVLVLLITLLIPRLARWFFRHVSESGGAQFLFVLAVVCACAYLSQYARMKPIIGAFLAGAAFNRQIPHHSALMNRLEFVGNYLFIPFFLISVGMLVDFQVILGDPDVWKVIGTMVGLVVATKWLAAQMAGLMFRHNRDERNVMFGLSVVQAAATLAAVLVGFEAGLLDERALNGAIAMIMVTVPLGSWAVQKYGRRMALAEESQPRVKRLEQRLLLAVSRPANAQPLMQLAMLIRDTKRPGGLFPLTIVPEGHDSDEAVAAGEKLLAQCINQAASAGMEVEPQVRVDLNPSDGILRAARELRAGMVMVGWGGSVSRGDWLFGSLQQQLTESCHPRLMLCRLLRPLNVNRCLRIPFPPLAEHRADLPELMREVKLLAKQAGLTLHVYLAGPAAGSLQSRFEKTTPGCETRFVLGDTWKEIRRRLFADLGPQDLLLLPQIRRETRLWTPTLDRLPELAAREFPDVNLLVVYPALRREGDVEGPVALPAGDGFPEVRAVDLPPDARSGERLRVLLEKGLPEDSDMAEEARPLLEDSARMTPVRLSEDALLLHAHCGERDDPLLLVGHGDPPVPFFGQEPPPKLVIVLLSPRSDAPEVHLRSLSQVAKRFRRAEVVERLASANDAAAVCRALGE